MTAPTPDPTTASAGEREQLIQQVLTALRAAWREEYSPLTVATGVADAILSNGWTPTVDGATVDEAGDPMVEGMEDTFSDPRHYQRQVDRVRAVHEFLIERLGEHDAVRNLSEGPSGEVRSVFVEQVDAEGLAAFIADALPYDLIAPIAATVPTSPPATVDEAAVGAILAAHGWEWGDGLEMLHCDCGWSIDGYIGHEEGLAERDAANAMTEGREVPAVIRHRAHVAQMIAATVPTSPTGTGGADDGLRALAEKFATVKIPQTSEGARMSIDDRCLNCNAVIRQINYSDGKRWMHVEPGAAFPTTNKGTAWRSCKLQIATPKAMTS